MLGCFRKHTADISGLSQLLSDDIEYFPPKKQWGALTGVICWGVNHQRQRSRKVAQRLGIPFFTLEEGFIAFSRDHTQQNILKFPLLSVIRDQRGIYYDARFPSDLEHLLNQISLSPEQEMHAVQLIDQILEHNITKFNTLSQTLPVYLQGDQDRVLVVDQTYNDFSVYCGLADEQSFLNMMAAAVAENPHAKIVIKTHPKVVEGVKKGYFTQLIKRYPAAIFCSEYVNPVVLIKSVQKIYTVTSQLGFEGLLAGKEVHCFGMPFYAGWGLTKDRLTCQRRLRQLSLLELFYASYVQYPLYLHPESKTRCTLSDIVRYVASQPCTPVQSVLNAKKSWYPSIKRSARELVRLWKIRQLKIHS